jgi:hypothetical protein
MAQTNPPFELDHISILTRVDAPEAALLENLGLVRFGGVSQHEGLGTASTSFFFENAYLELLWAHDGELAQKHFSVVHYDLDARARWQDTLASPFGIMLRRSSLFAEGGPQGGGAMPPFPTEPFQFNQQPVDFSAQNSAEPACGFLPAALSYPSFKHTITNRAHPLGVKEITRVTINIYDEFQPSPLARWLTENQIAIIQPAAFANLEIEFDHGAQGESINLRPDLPLVLKY